MNKAEAQDNANNAAAEIDLILIKYNVYQQCMSDDPFDIGVIDKYVEDKEPKQVVAKTANVSF